MGFQEAQTSPSNGESPSAYSQVAKKTRYSIIYTGSPYERTSELEKSALHDGASCERRTANVLKQHDKQEQMIRCR